MRASPLDLFEQPAKGFLSILLGKKKLANAKLEIRYSKQIQKGNTKQIQCSKQEESDWAFWIFWF